MDWAGICRKLGRWMSQPFRLQQLMWYRLAMPRMIEVAERVAQGFGFMQVDVYSVGGRVMLGEMTPHPGNALVPITPVHYDELWGSFLEEGGRSEAAPSHHYIRARRRRWRAASGAIRDSRHAPPPLLHEL